MGLTANPFHPATGQLLDGYRDAYLRGDLSRRNTEQVDAYLQANPEQGGEAFRRFHNLKAAGHGVRPVGWVQQQLHLIRTEPARFRQRAMGLVMAGVLVSGMVFAGNNKVGPVEKAATMLKSGAAGSISADVARAELAAAVTVLRGRVLDENGQPLIGATVLDRESGRGVSTNADGDYALSVPAARSARLQYGYGGYHEEEVATRNERVLNVTLLPDTGKQARTRKRHWWRF